MYVGMNIGLRSQPLEFLLGSDLVCRIRIPAQNWELLVRVSLLPVFIAFIAQVIQYSGLKLSKVTINVKKETISYLWK